MIYNKIAENPLYENKNRHLLMERGFKFWENISEYTPELLRHLNPKHNKKLPL